MDNAEITRLSKKLANTSDLSRREASEAIKKGEVSVNHEIIKDPAFALSGQEEIRYKGQLIKEKTLLEYYVFNKAKSMCFGQRSEKNRPSVLEIMKKTTTIHLSSVHPVADEMCGLILLTNDDEIVKKYEKKESVVKQLYELILPANITDAGIEQIKNFLFGEKILKCKHVNVVRSDEEITLIIEMYGFEMEKTLVFLKKNQIEYRKLDRVYFGGITKKDISRGWFRAMTKQEIILLKHFYNPPPTKKYDQV